MRRGHECPECGGVDTQQIVGSLWTCADCGDEVTIKRSAAPGHAQNPPSRSEPGAAPFWLEDARRPKHVTPAMAVFALEDPSGSGLRNFFLGLVELSPGSGDPMHDPWIARDVWRTRDGQIFATAEEAGQHLYQARAKEEKC